MIERATNTGRIAALDGLRGIAAAGFAFGNMLGVILPGLAIGAMAPNTRPWMLWISTSPLYVFYHATMLVYVIFTISGLAVALASEHAPVSVATWIARRYLRLTLPMVASLIIAWPLAHFLGFEMARIGSVLGHFGFETLYAQPTPAFEEALSSGFADVYVRSYSYFNPALWVMQVELLGSVATYAACRLLSPRWTNLAAVAAILLLILVGGTAARAICFPAGVLVLSAYRNGALKSRWIGWAALGVGIALSGLGQSWLGVNFIEPTIGTLNNIGDGVILIYAIAGPLIVVSVLSVPTVALVLERRPVQFLGRISFGLFLIHFPLSLTVLAGLFLAANGSAHGGLSALLALGFFVFLLAAATLFTLSFDEPIKRWLKRWREEDTEQAAVTRS